MSGAPLPSASQVLATFTQAIPAEAPAPAAALRINNPEGKSLVAVPFPNVDTILSALGNLGRRRLLDDGAPAPAPGQPGAFPALPTNLEVGGNQADPNADDSFAESQWYQTTSSQPGGGPGQPQPAAQLQAQPAANPQPQPAGQPQPLQNVELQTDQPAQPGPMPGPQPLVAQAPAGAQPSQPQPQPGAAAPALAEAPAVFAAQAPKIFGPVPDDVKEFTTRLVNFLGAEARQKLPSRVSIGAGAGRRRLAQDGSDNGDDAPLASEPLAADAPMSAPGKPHAHSHPIHAPLPCQVREFFLDCLRMKGVAELRSDSSVSVRCE